MNTTHPTTTQEISMPKSRLTDAAFWLGPSETPVFPIRSWLSIPVVAEKLDVSPRRVRALIISGELKGTPVGRRLKVHFDDLETYRNASKRASKRSAR